MTINSVDTALNDQESDVVVMPLITIKHNSMVEELRFVSNTEDVTASGEVFTAFPFHFELPNDDGNTPRAKLTIPNIDRRIDKAARDIIGAPKIEVSIIAADDPDNPLITLRDLELRDIEGDVESIRGTIQSTDQTQEPYPFKRATSDRFPGVRKPT